MFYVPRYADTTMNFKPSTRCSFLLFLAAHLFDFNETLAQAVSGNGPIFVNLLCKVKIKIKSNFH